MSSNAPHRRNCALVTRAAAGRLFGWSSILLAVSCPIAKAVEPAPNYSYFSWNESAGGTYTAQVGGVSGAMRFTTTGDDIIFGHLLATTDNDFVARFGSEVPTMFFENGTLDPTADALAQAAFTPALPAGARLLVVDVDQASSQERVQITWLGGSLSLLEQIESQAGANSSFPTWNPATGILQSVNGNDKEVSVFDVSGARALDLRFMRSIGAGNLSGSYFAIALPVPEPTGLMLVAVCVATCAIFHPRAYPKKLKEEIKGDGNQMDCPSSFPNAEACSALRR